MFCRTSIIAALTACLPITALSETTLSINSSYFEKGDLKWEGYTYTARDLVGSLNSIGSEMMLKGHDYLDLESAAPQSRLLYLLSAGFVNFRFQYANSVIFGHELAHWQHARRFGRTDHSFQDDNAQRASLGKVYLDTLLSGSINYTAVSTPTANFNQELYNREGIETSLHALNWQMSYSEEWIKDALFYQNKTAFDATELFLNRIYLTAYAVGDYRRNSSDKGDMHKFASHIAPGADRQDTLAKISLISFAATLLSPGVTGTVTNVAQYIASGDTGFTIQGLKTSAGTYFLDVPTYINYQSYTVAPTLYLLANDSIAQMLGSDRLLLSSGFEVAALGESEAELRLGAKANFGAVEIDTSFTSNGRAHFAELEVGYNVTDTFELYAGAAVTDGRTLRARRNMPEGGDVVWLGTRLRF